MATQKGYLLSGEGILKIVTIVFGIITIGCGIPSYNEDYKEEVYFYGAALACLIASVAFFPIFLISSALDGNSKLKFIDFTYHVILGIVLIVASSMMIKSAVDKKNPIGVPTLFPADDTKNFEKKVAAGAFGLVNSLIYLVASVLVIRSKNEDTMSFSKRYGPASS